ncbi:uncharacterized protein YlxW (UPF0749 family) [Asanoa ferruginea]|uniref:Uncharacterized protein YlxW (UPF0749 family) n=1 Tax=Asanoa ferruginea TaxID=53367 RepID=A0A3D9ZTH4_9ACTN|nr:DUF881 domain-containing protein [Asanoa ferruginea]REG00687.1 uncharacterized protein YlxW (UPF0749 family) [Asanoa ferruginea]GIF47440.1 hypothetical protein Afe04nite_19790 [Asanoa ferruginea]
MTDDPRESGTPAEPAKPARKPTPGRQAANRASAPAQPPEPELGQEEATVRLSPVTPSTTGELSPPEPEPETETETSEAPEAADDEATVALPRAERSTGATVTPPPVSDEGEPEPEADPAPARAVRKRRGTAGVIILVLLALLGFTLAVQLRGKSVDSDLAAMREDDLVRLQSDLQGQEDRLQREIASLEDSQRQLQSGAQGRAAAMEEAKKRADELAILAGTAAAQGPGLTIRFVAGPEPIAASDILNAVQELRGADAEAMQIAGVDGTTVRIVASTYFIDADGGIEVSGKRLTGAYTITVIGDPPTMRTALNIPDGLVPSIKADGGNVIVDEHDTVDVTAIAEPVNLKHAKPVS